MDYEIGKGKPPKHTQWQPGQSGNPGGLPKGTPRVSAALMRLLRTAPDETYEPQNKADLIAMRLFKSSMQGDTMALRELLDRTEGKVSQSLQVTAAQLPTSEIHERLISAFTQAGVDEEQARKVILELAAGGDE